MKKNVLRNSILGVVIFLCFLLIFAATWVNNTFGVVTLDQLVFHMTVPIDGTNRSLISQFIIEVLAPTIIFSFAIMFVVCYNYKYAIDIKFGFKKINFTFSFFPFGKIIKVIGCLGFIFYSIFFTIKKLDIKSYINDIKNPSTFIEEVYVDPNEANITFPKEKKNLIYIYLESMESSYSSVNEGGIIEVNLIPNLTKLAKENISFSNSNKLGGSLSTEGTTWTMAALVAHSSGLPLKLSIGANSYGNYEKHLPGATTIGDILEDNGYNQMFMIGSKSTFGGRDKFYVQHGNYFVYDWFYLVDNGVYTAEDYVWWGYEDESLYKYAQEEILKLASKDEPFNFTMLTVDTHFEDGWLSESCVTPYGDQYKNVINCADTMLNDFINWIKSQDFYDDTVIVISGDHLTMDVDFFDSYSSDYQRSVYNVFINSELSTNNKYNRVFSTLDMFPTTLASLGVTFDGDRLGLGTNLFSDSKTIFEEYGYDYVNSEFRKRSNFYTDKFILGN